MNADPKPAGTASESDAAPPPSATAPLDDQGTVDARNPWLGLVSFTEETRAYFFGREEEVAELARRVQRKLLTILFGKSGLGKTSILRAGLVPRLRAHGYCPVYVRIAYGRDTPEPAEQIKEAIRRAANASGEWTQAGVAAAGESLWEFLHHRDDVLHDATGATLIPLLIFDQFEELFTLAQSDEFGRARAARFIEDLADLVENRPPNALEARLDEDDAAAERFDFARSDYRVLIALREDYLAPLESLKRTMPSLSQNRLRLAPMTGEQALEAVLQPGRGLVSQEVAEAIVRFVAGGSELANAEVEPSLLSLICRELNDARLAQAREEISIDLLAGSHESILTNFYERSLADQPPSVRRIIEDELLTESGFRENVAEETLLRRFQASGAAAGTLATLVNRRLLRIEERLDVRRVELTHDVLCGVVKASRDQRHEREAREVAERVLEEQRARERAARHALARARAVAAGCILLAVVALSAAAYGYVSARRAHRAELIAQHSRAVAEQARTHAEALLGYLTDTFVRELESFGRLDVLAQFTQREIDYFNGLPPELRSTETVRNGALAFIDHARAVDFLGQTGTGLQDTNSAIGLLEGLRQHGDRSEATLVALGAGYTVRCTLLVDVNEQGAPATCRRAAAILQPLAQRPGASFPARRAYVEALTELGWDDLEVNDNEGAVRTEQQAMRIAAEIGGKNLSNLQMSADYAEAGTWRVEGLASLGRTGEALRIGTEVLAVASGVLQQRPGHRLALHAKQITEDTMAEVAYRELDPRGAMQYASQASRTARVFLQLDPNNVAMLNDLAVSLVSRGDLLWALGRPDGAIDSYRKALQPLAETVRAGAFFIRNYESYLAMTGLYQALSGDLTGAMRTAASAQTFFERNRAHLPQGGKLFEMWPRYVRTLVSYERGDFTQASELAAQAIEQVRAARLTGGALKIGRPFFLSSYSDIYGRAAYQLGHFAVAESALRAALKWGETFASSGRRPLDKDSSWLAMALAKQGKRREAAQVIGPVVKRDEKRLARDHGDVWVPYELAGALYAQSLAEPAYRERLLPRAAALLRGLPPPLKRLRAVRRWQGWVAQSLRGH
jgi:tetratricopeptide (TPR) repeat protein